MFDETKVQIGNDVLLDVSINPDWYISSVGYECGYEEKAREVTITLRNKEDENKLRRTLGELIAEPKDEPQTDDDKKHCVFCKWAYEPNVCGRCRNMNLFADEIEDEQSGKE